MQLISLGISELQLFLGMEMDLDNSIILVGLLNHFPLTSQIAKLKKKNPTETLEKISKSHLKGLMDFDQTDLISEYFLLH